MSPAFTIKNYYVLSALFVVVNTVLIYHEVYWLFLLPVLIMLAALAFLRIDWVFMVSALATPLSLNLSEMDLGASVSVPSEPLIVGTMILFIFKVIIEQSLDQRFLKHPVTWMVGFYLLWMGFTSITSQEPMVSFKFWLSKVWFITVFYFLGVHIFSKWRNIPLFMWMYVLSFIGVIIYTIARHAAWNFEKDPAHWVMEPFYNDHTQYAAMLAMYFPFVVGFAFFNRLGLFNRIVVFLVATLFATALILSNTRAAWLSIIGMFGIFVVMALRIRWYYVFSTVGILVLGFFAFKTEIIMKLEKNKQDSSGELTEHIQSMSNISTDASNLERLLRWNAALRMFEERPVVGWGPGAYSFCYAPFQRSYEMTIISTNFGDGGNAHSEYLGPLAEQGVLGLVNFIMLGVITFITACKVIYSQAERKVKQMAYFVILGLCTYWIHGFLNNFLDTDKAAVPFWGFIAALVAMDIFHAPKSAHTDSDS